MFKIQVSDLEKCKCAYNLTKHIVSNKILLACACELDCHCTSQISKLFEHIHTALVLGIQFCCAHEAQTKKNQIEYGTVHKLVETCERHFEVLLFCFEEKKTERSNELLKKRNKEMSEKGKEILEMFNGGYIDHYSDYHWNFRYSVGVQIN